MRASGWRGREVLDQEDGGRGGLPGRAPEQRRLRPRRSISRGLERKPCLQGGAVFSTWAGAESSRGVRAMVDWLARGGSHGSGVPYLAGTERPRRPRCRPWYAARHRGDRPKVDEEVHARLVACRHEHPGSADRDRPVARASASVLKYSRSGDSNASRQLLGK
jgi:hypothetical protein